MTAKRTKWDDKTTARLRALWTEGHSTAEIGRRLHRSKNAVVGKADRLGLTGRPSPICHKMDPDTHRARTRAGIEAARAADTPIGRPRNTKRDAEIAELLVKGWGVLKISAALQVSHDVVRRVRDASA